MRRIGIRGLWGGRIGWEGQKGLRRGLPVSGGPTIAGLRARSGTCRKRWMS